MSEQTRKGTTTNIGQLGVESIRIAETKIEDLPLVAGAHAKKGIAAAIENVRLHKIQAIHAKYPAETTAYLDGWLKECQENIQRIQILKGQQSTMINEYTGHISMCKYRDEEIAKLDEDLPGELAQIKLLKKRFPPYQVGKMEDQIGFCKEALERSDEVIEKEFKSIAMLQSRRVLCVQRDLELQAAGANPIG